MTIFVGDDWAESNHDVHLMNEAGECLGARRLPEGLEGLAKFYELVADHVEDPDEWWWASRSIGACEWPLWPAQAT